VAANEVRRGRELSAARARGKRRRRARAHSRSAALCSSRGLSHETASVMTLWKYSPCERGGGAARSARVRSATRAAARRFRGHTHAVDRHAQLPPARTRLGVGLGVALHGERRRARSGDLRRLCRRRACGRRCGRVRRGRCGRARWRAASRSGHHSWHRHSWHRHHLRPAGRRHARHGDLARPASRRRRSARPAGRRRWSAGPTRWRRRSAGSARRRRRRAARAARRWWWRPTRPARRWRHPTRRHSAWSTRWRRRRTPVHVGSKRGKRTGKVRDSYSKLAARGVRMGAKPPTPRLGWWCGGPLPGANFE
jgi:hypothetical protein